MRGDRNTRLLVTNPDVGLKKRDLSNTIMPTASTAALRKRRQEKKAAAEKLKEKETTQGEAEMKPRCKITLVRNSHSGNQAVDDKEIAARKSPTPIAAGKVVVGHVAKEPASDNEQIELNTINLVGGRILTTKRRDEEEEEVVAMERARKRLTAEGEDIVAVTRGLNVDADEKLYTDLEKLDVSESQIVIETPLGTSKSMYRDRDPVPHLEDFQPAPTWTEEPMMLMSNTTLDSRLKNMSSVEVGEEGDENFPFDTFEMNREQHWKDLERFGFI